jgi:hypothetical protein
MVLWPLKPLAGTQRSKAFNLDKITSRVPPHYPVEIKLEHTAGRIDKGKSCLCRRAEQANGHEHHPSIDPLNNLGIAKYYRQMYSTWHKKDFLLLLLVKRD